ncbi:ArfGAP with FG repeats 1 [Quaeritorhiza haematococci]|nr:ArfGAP with FG repeats 1 [Quaeritorhiza haematococci]
MKVCHSQRIKSVSASVFTPKEIQDLQEGGNSVAAKIWLGKFNPGEYAEPDVNDMFGIKAFMEKKYVDKQWYKPPEERYQETVNKVQAIPDTFVVKVAALPSSNATAKSVQSVQQASISKTVDLLGDLTISTPTNTVSATPVVDEDFGDFQSSTTPTSAFFPPNVQPAANISSFASFESAFPSFPTAQPSSPFQTMTSPTTPLSPVTPVMSFSPTVPQPTSPQQTTSVPLSTNPSSALPTAFDDPYAALRHIDSRVASRSEVFAQAQEAPVKSTGGFPVKRQPSMASLQQKASPSLLVQPNMGQGFPTHGSAVGGMVGAPSAPKQQQPSPSQPKSAGLFGDLDPLKTGGTSIPATANQTKQRPLSFGNGGFDFDSLI